MKKQILIAIVALLLLAGGGGAWLYFSGGADKGGGAGPHGDYGQRPPQAVSVLPLATQTINMTYKLPGRVTAYRQSQVRPQVDGIITARLFEEGSTVEKGQPLYQIDDARYRAALNSTLADLKSAEASVKTVEARANRYTELVKIDAVSQQEYDDVVAQLDQAKAAIAVAQAAVDVAQVNLDYTKVYAPIDGRISRSFVTEGALVTASQSQHLATITQLQPVYVDMQQSGAEAVDLRAYMTGQDKISVTLYLDDASQKKYPHKGELKFSEVTVDETAGSVTLRAQVPNPDELLLPGLFVRAQLDLGAHELLLVPQRAATRMPDGSLQVWTVNEDNKARPRTVTASQSHGSNWIVSSGLKAGDKVIVEGYQKVGPDMVVAPSLWEETAGK